MKNLSIISIFIFIILNVFIFTDVLYANDDSDNSNGYIILNLHLSEGEITLNSMKKAMGFTKKAGRKNITQPFFYALFSEDGETIGTGRFKIPQKLYYDYFDESTGELTGGQLQRDELDFVIRVPYFHKAKQIMFYKTYKYSYDHTMTILGESDDHVLLGTINF